MASYRECPACGKRALSIATRCPSCGHELLAEPVRRGPSGDGAGLRPLPLIALVIAAAAGLVVLGKYRGAARERETRTTAAVRVETPTSLDTTHAAASPTLPDSAPGAEAVQRIARTWTKVRAHRSTHADVVAVLLPGDTVLADSLRGGWWRVGLEGRVLGYVYARTLTEP